MTAYDFVQMALLAVGGRIQGKTKLQKLVYFLGSLTDCLDELGYRPHFYGPYSSAVADAVERLRALGFIEQEVSGGGMYDGRGFEVLRHDFQMNEPGRAIAERKAQQNPQWWERITAATQVLRKGGDLNYVQLSIAAKTHLMLGEKNGSASVKELADLASKFGWVVSEEEARAAAQFLRDVGLVSLA